MKAADQDNEQRKRLELAAKNANNKTEEDVAKKNKLNQKKQQVIFLSICLQLSSFSLHLPQMRIFLYIAKSL